jgi:UDP-hydrolysing UDP-N-acetyl-D-glucosamine 2-epimerase
MKKICVFTGSRAEYGLLYWTMKEIKNCPDLDLQVLVSGSHFSKRLGETWRQIVSDGFNINAKVPFAIDDDSPLGLAKATGQGVSDLAETLAQLETDILIILGDRYEALSAATAATMLRIPIAHIHGGESTEGAIDDAIRHAITQLSQMHFVAANSYQEKVIQMGADPETVHNVGALGIEGIKRAALLSRDELSVDLDFNLDGTVFLLTYHPVTKSNRSPDSALDELFTALDSFPDANLIFTKANADTDGQMINDRIDHYAAIHPERIFVTASLGQQRYLSAMAVADVVIGNSSSGIIEAPAIGTPTVNIGNRQGGRLSAASVLHCTNRCSDISEAIKEALGPRMQNIARKKQSPYGAGDSAGQIKSILQHVDCMVLLNNNITIN